MPETPNEPVEVYRAARGLAEAHAVRLLLDAEGIAAWVDNEFLQGATGELPLGWSTAPRVLVGRPDGPAALAAVAGFAWTAAAADPSGEPTCLACQAPMGAADTCPACGWSYRDETQEAEPAEPTIVTDGPPDPPAAGEPPPPVLSRPALGAEVAAVLAVGVVPNLLSTLVTLHSPAPPLPTGSTPSTWPPSADAPSTSPCT